MVKRESIRTVIGIIGNVISYFLFLSPIPTFWKIHKAKSVQEFKPDPYLMTLLNCGMWIFYGLRVVHPSSILMVTTNGIGFLIEIIFITIFLVYSDWPNNMNILTAVTVEVMSLNIIANIALRVIQNTKKRSMLVGIICIVFNIGMYISPLTIMKRVIETKSVKYMPFCLSLANFLNGCVWTVYALLKFDINILIPNGVGVLSGAIQLILYAVYYRRSEDNNVQEHSAQVQLSNTNGGNYATL